MHVRTQINNLWKWGALLQSGCQSMNDCNDLDNAWQLVTKFQIKPASEVFQVQQIS